MSTKEKKVATPDTGPAAEGIEPLGSPVSLEELTCLLIKHYKLHDGLYNLMVQFQIGAGPVGPDGEKPAPGIKIGVSNFGLIKAVQRGPGTVDASEVNPLKKPSSRRRATE